MALAAYAKQQGHFVTLKNGQKDHFYVDSFMDPWLPESEKPVILIQHGYGRSAPFWYHWIPELSRDYIVIRRDLRGHGLSSYPKRSSPWSEPKGTYEAYDYGVSTIVGEIVEFLDKLEIDKVHFLGESTSGELGMAFAAKHPDRIRSLITCSSPTCLPPATCEFLAMGHSTWPEAVMQLGSRGWAEALSSQAGTAPTASKKYLDWWLRGVGANPAEGMAGYADFLSQLNVREFLPEVKCPVLVLAPTSSRAVPLSESYYVAEHIKGSQLHEIQAAGHEIYVEAPEECIKLVKGFISAF